MAHGVEEVGEELVWVVHVLEVEEEAAFKVEEESHYLIVHE